MSRLIEQLRIHKDDRGMMANLRCALVKNKAHRAWPVLNRLGVPINNDVQVQIAALFATHSDDDPSAGNFGSTCRAIRVKRDQKTDDKLTPTERRFQHLISAERHELPGRVLRMVLMAKSQGIPVNFTTLATDLKYWNDCTKIEWASSFWTQGATTSMESEE
ncbi:MAG: type I-E CRISPR-associated protein Cse2/CasB [Sedimenticola sp.]